MIINKFKKIKGNKYKVYFENQSITLYDDIIIKYNLLTHKKLDIKLLNEITDESSKLESYYVAIKYINTKLRSEKEIREYLSKKNCDSDTIEETINKLKKNNFLNEDLYLSSYINDQANLTNNGPLKIINSLLSLGFNEDKILSKIDLNDSKWNEKLKKYIAKKTKLNHKLSTYELKNKLKNELINLGYSPESINSELENVANDDENTFKKMADKYYNKYKKKYNDEKLKYYFRNKMYQLGYNSELIEAFLNNNHISN